MRTKFNLRKSDIVILMLLIGFTISASCVSRVHMQNENNKNAVSFLNSPASNTANELIKNTNQVYSSPTPNPFVIPKEEADKGLEQINKEIYKEVYSLSKMVGLSRLNKEKFLPNDKEIRIWKVGANRSSRGFIYTHKQGESLALSRNCD